MSDCSECGKEALPKLKVCRVCELIDGDTTEKLCGWCEQCQAWICIPDQTEWVRRSKAFFKNIVS